MKPTALLLTLLALLAILSPAWAGTAEEEATRRLHELYPKIPVASVSPAPVAGLYEIVDKQDNIFYFAPANGYLIAGEIYSPQGQSLTRARYEALMTAKYPRIPLDKGLKIGDGPNVVVEITDPDCPYCRAGAAFWSQQKGVTRYIFFTPLTKIHPEAEQKARFILSSPNPAETYQDVMDGLYDDKPLPEFKDNGRLDQQIAVGKMLNTKGTPNYWVNGQFVSGSNHDNLKRLLKPVGDGQ